MITLTITAPEAKFLESFLQLGNHRQARLEPEAKAALNEIRAKAIQALPVRRPAQREAIVGKLSLPDEEKVHLRLFLQALAEHPMIQRSMPSISVLALLVQKIDAAINAAISVIELKIPTALAEVHLLADYSQAMVEHLSPDDSNYNGFYQVNMAAQTIYDLYCKDVQDQFVEDTCALTLSLELWACASALLVHVQQETREAYIEGEDDAYLLCWGLVSQFLKKIFQHVQQAPKQAA